MQKLEAGAMFHDRSGLVLWAAAIIIVLGVAGYVSAYYVLVQRHFETFSADSQTVYLDETTHAVFWPAIRVYERVTGDEVAVNPLIHPLDPP